MTLDTILQAIEGALTPLVAAAGGNVKVSEAELDAFNQLDSVGERFQVIISPGGGKVDNERDLSGLTADEVHVYLQCPKQLTANAAKGLHKQRAGAPLNFMGRLGWLTKQLRSLVLDSPSIDTECGRSLRYLGWEWLRVGDSPALLRAARLRFEVVYVLDEPDAPEATTLSVGAPMLLQVVGQYLHISTAPGQTKRVRLLEL